MIPLAESVSTLLDFDLDFLFEYQIFPPRLLTFFGEWQNSGRTMRTGDVIVQEASVPPFALGLKMLFGVRILSTYWSENEAGFSYGTLAGHPEIGTNDFSIRIRRGCVFAVVETRSDSGLWITKLLGPLVARYIDYCNRQAALNMAGSFVACNSCHCSPQ